MSKKKKRVSPLFSFLFFFLEIVLKDENFLGNELLFKGRTVQFFFPVGYNTKKKCGDCLSLFIALPKLGKTEAINVSQRTARSW